MELIEVLRSKVGQQIRIPPTSRMTVDGRRRVSMYVTNAKSKGNDFHEIAKEVVNAIDATGIELNTRRGKWVTRFRKELKSRHILLTDRELGRVGDIVMMNTDQDGPWFVDFTDKLDWTPGNFEDEGSCFWAGRANNRDMLEFYHALAMRTYRNDDFDRGSGRVWIAKPNSSEDFDYVMMFNAYGKRLDKCAYILKCLLAIDDINVITHQVDDFGNSDGDFWTNQGQGFAVSTSAEVEKLDYVRLNYVNIHGLYTWYVYNNSGRLPNCEKCGVEIRPTIENPFIEKYDVRTWNDSNKLYCPDCIEKIGIHLCPNCQHFHPNSHFTRDLHNHETCVYSAHWLTLCECGLVMQVSAGEFEECKLGEWDVSKLNRGRCWHCNSRLKYLFGSMCHDCYNMAVNRIERLCGYDRDNIRDNITKVTRILSTYGQKIERKET